MVHLARTGGTKMYSFCYAPSPPHFSLRPPSHSAYNTHQTQKTSKPVLPLRHSQDIRKPCDKGRLSRPSSASAAEPGAARPRPRRQQRVGMSEVLVSLLLCSTGEGWKRPTLHVGLGTQVMQGAATLCSVGTCPKWILWEDTGRLPHVDGGDQRSSRPWLRQLRQQGGLSTRKSSAPRRGSSAPHQYSYFSLRHFPKVFYCNTNSRGILTEVLLPGKGLTNQKASNKSGGLIKAITPFWKFYLRYK